MFCRETTEYLLWRLLWIFSWVNFGCGRKVTRKADQNKNNNDKNTNAFQFVFSFAFYSIIRHFKASCYYCQPRKLRKGNVFSHACVPFCPQVRGKRSRRSHVTITFDAFYLTKRDPHLHHRRAKGPHCTVVLAPSCVWTLFTNVCQFVHITTNKNVTFTKYLLLFPKKRPVKMRIHAVLKTYVFKNVQGLPYRILVASLLLLLVQLRLMSPAP